MVNEATVDSLIYQHGKDIPNAIKWIFKVEIWKIKDAVKDATGNWNNDLSSVVQQAVYNWVSLQLIPITYKRYRERLSHWVDIKTFGKWSNKVDPNWETIWKRFTIIEKKWIKVWDDVIELKTWKKYKVSWISPSVMLHLDWLHEPQNPIKYTKPN